MAGGYRRAMPAVMAMLRRIRPTSVGASVLQAGGDEVALAGEPPIHQRCWPRADKVRTGPARLRFLRSRNRTFRRTARPSTSHRGGRPRVKSTLRYGGGAAAAASTLISQVGEARVAGQADDARPMSDKAPRAAAPVRPHPAQSDGRRDSSASRGSRRRRWM